MEILRELSTSDLRVVWQARRSEDRGRLQVVAVVAPSSVPVVVELLSDSQLRQLLTEGSDQQTDAWVCAECGASNARGRGWCATCSAHTDA